MRSIKRGALGHVEDAFQSLRPGHGRVAFGRHLVLRLIECLGLAGFATPGGRHQRTVLAVRGKHPMGACQVNAGPGHQSYQPGNEVQRLKDDMRGANSRCNQCKADNPMGNITAPA